MKKEMSYLASCFFLLLLVLIYFLNLYDVGFTTHDDILSSMMALSGGEITNGSHWANANAVAQSAGRVHFLVGYYLWLVPYLLKSSAYLFLIRILSIWINTVLFGYLVYQVYFKIEVALFFAFIFLGIQQITWEHSILVSYPALYTTAASVFLLAIISFRNKHLKLSAFLYFLSLWFYEMFVAYFMMFLALTYSEVKFSLKQWIPKIKNHILVLFLFLGIYGTYRYFYSGVYEGNQVKEISIDRINAVLSQYSVSTTPGYFYIKYDELFKKFSLKELSDRTQLLMEWPLAFQFWSLILLFLILLFRAKPVYPSKKIIYGSIILVLIFLPLSNLFIALTPQKQEWVIDRGSLAYTTSYFGTFFVAFLLGNLFLFLLHWPTKLRLNPLVRKITVFILFIIGSFMTLSINYIVTEHQSMAQARFRLIDYLFENYKDQIPEGSLLLAQDLWKTETIAQISEENFWSNYVWYKFGKKVDFKNCSLTCKELSDKKNKDSFLVTFSQSFKDKYSSLLLAKIINSSLNKGSFTQYQISEGLNIIEGNPSEKAFFYSRTFYKEDVVTRQPSPFARHKLHVFKIESNKNQLLPIFEEPDGINIYKTNTFFFQVKNCYPLEKSGQHQWNWCQNKSHIEFVILDNEDHKKVLQFVLKSLSSGRFMISLNNKKVSEINLEKFKEKIINIPFDAKNNFNILSILSTAQEQTLTQGDSRKAVYQITDISISKD